jgi:hypothetical protein
MILGMVVGLGPWFATKNRGRIPERDSVSSPFLADEPCTRNGAPKKRKDYLNDLTADASSSFTSNTV